MLGDLALQSRLSANLSKQELSRMAGVSVPAIRLVENERGRISTLLSMLDAMNAEIGWRGYRSERTLGENLRIVRHNSGRPQRYVAAALGVSKNTIQAMEATGQGRVETLARLIQYLRLRPMVTVIGAVRRQKRLIPAKNGHDADIVYTPADLAKLIIDHFPLDGRILDPCRGTGAFYDQFPDYLDREWCEIEAGRDFFAWREQVDWLVSNPPWGRIRDFLQHSMEVATNVVLLATLNHFSTKARLNDIRTAGFGVREIVLFPTPKGDWPASGFQVAAVHVQRGWSGPCRMTDRYMDPMD